MQINIDPHEIIPIENFELYWRFDNVHNADFSEQDKKEIFPLSEIESKKIKKIIDYFKVESNRFDKFVQTDWFMANSESDEKIERFKEIVDLHLKSFTEDILISWNRRLVLKTSKMIFLKYWTDFLYAVSDDVTIISEKTNWILFYNHIEVANIWKRI